VEIPFRNRRVRVAKLELLVELKRQSTFPEDRERLAVLEATLRRARER
jgi:hypothetical protein